MIFFLWRHSFSFLQLVGLKCLKYDERENLGILNGTDVDSVLFWRDDMRIEKSQCAQGNGKHMTVAR